MRRLIVTLSVVAMIAALLPFVALVATAQAAGPAPTIAPPAGKTAVRATDAVTVTGDAAGAPDGPVNATLIGLRPDGTEMFRETGVPGVEVSGGQFEGELVLSCGFGEPGPTRCSSVNPDPTGLVAAVAVKLSGVDRSNAVRVDYTDPELLRYELVDATHVRVVFSEPVRLPSSGMDRPTDWEIDNVSPVDVNDPVDPACSYPEAAMSTGCTRLLTLATSKTEDATPFGEYLPNAISRLSAAYQDYASNSLAISAAENSEALDRIRPAAPNIQSIDGKTPTAGEVISNNNAPTVRVTNLLENHTARLVLTRDGGSPRRVETTVAPGTNAVDLALPAMTADDGYTVSAVAVDAAGNRSNDDTKTGPAERDNGALPVATYTLDRRAPAVLAATLIDTRTVSVEMTEAILPDGDAGKWSVGNIPVTASGGGTTRTLKAQVSLANPGLLRWQPTSAEVGSNGRYGDRAGNGMTGLTGLELNDLPPLSAPQILAPTTTLFTTGNSVVVRGTADNRPNLVAELFDRGAEAVKTSAPVNDGRWSINQPLADDGRFLFEVRIRDTKTGIVSQRNRVADVVRDTVAPEVEVHEPAEVMFGTPPEYGIGDAVTVEWTATDAADDPKIPDHSNSVRVIMVSDSGTRRDVSGRLEAQPGREQSHTFRLTKNDLEGLGLMDLHFEVIVDDLADNDATGLSGDIRLLDSLLGFAPVLTAQTAGGSTSIIDVRFPTAVTGPTGNLDWRVDGMPPAAAQLSEDQRSVTLTVPFLDDPNAQPMVQHTPTTPSQRLHSASNRQVTLNPRKTLDRIAPALSVTVPDRPSVVDADQLVFSGETDTSDSPNLIAAWRTRASGERVGRVLAKKRAATDGAWSLAVPLAPNQINRIVIQAIDPSANRSELLPSSPYTVTEDSVAPVVRIQSPRRGTATRRVVPIRWSTVERNPSHARLQYRVRGGEWKTIASRTSDDGFFRWTAPKSLHADVFDLRVQAFDRTGKRRTTAVFGILGDFARPVVRRAVAVGARSVRLHFSERVYMPRFGYTVDGIGVRRVVHNGAVNTLVLNRPMSRTTPVVRYGGTSTRDLVGNRLATFKRTAERGFVFGVTNVRGNRLSTTRVRVTWEDTRNRPANIKYYRVYRDSVRIGTVGAATRAFVDTAARGASTYSVRAFDNEGRYSAPKAVYVR